MIDREFVFPTMDWGAYQHVRMLLLLATTRLDDGAISHVAVLSLSQAVIEKFRADYRQFRRMSFVDPEVQEVVRESEPVVFVDLDEAGMLFGVQAVGNCKKAPVVVSPQSFDPDRVEILRCESFVRGAGFWWSAFLGSVGSCEVEAGPVLPSFFDTL